MKDQLLDDGSGGLAWTVSFYGCNGHGNVRYLTDTAGNVADTYDYDAFGKHNAEMKRELKRAIEDNTLICRKQEKKGRVDVWVAEVPEVRTCGMDLASAEQALLERTVTFAISTSRSHFDTTTSRRPDRIALSRWPQMRSRTSRNRAITSKMVSVPPASPDWVLGMTK